MNDTTVMGGAASREDVLDYVDAVRAWLGDLPPEEVDDLTAGMEADLAERAAESGARLGDLLGQPEEYAAELRSAAGLPPRAAHPADAPRPGVLPDLATALAASARRTLVRWPWLRELRPTWWLARGWVIGWLVAQVLGTDRVVLLPILSAAVSFWVGRRFAARPAGPGRGLLLGGVNVVAVLVLVPAAIFYLDTRMDDVDAGPVAQAGVTLDGGLVSNLFVFDAGGNRVEGARLFTQDGRVVAVDPDVVPLGSGSEAAGSLWPPDPASLSVFPLQVGDNRGWAGREGLWVPPVAIAPVAVPPAPGATGSPVPSASPTPSASASSTPTATASSPSATASSSVPPTHTPTPTP